MNLKRLYSKIASIGAAIGACSCITMIAATIVGLVGLIGLPIALALPDPVNSFLQLTAQPLLILSLILIVFSTMHSTSRIPLLLSSIGAPPTYAGMFLIPGSMSMMGGVHTIHSVSPVPLLVFWVGVAILVASIVTARRKREILLQPMGRFAPLIARRLVLATVLVGVLVLVPTVSLTGISGVTPSRPTETQTAAQQPALVKIDKDSFLWKGTVLSYTKEENYFPRFSGAKATVSIKHRIVSGTLTIGIMDGMGAWVLRAKTVTGTDPPTIEFTTQSGMSGVWMIILAFRGVSGDMEISVKSV